MNDPVAVQTKDRRIEGRPWAPRFSALLADAWSFVYVFFTNGIPFDAPNRSEPCPAPDA